MNKRHERLIRTISWGLRAVAVELTPIVLLALVLVFLHVTPVQANIVADPEAPGTRRPTVLSTANGLPQVNIQLGSVGVLRNARNRFDVEAKRVIFNNSRTGKPSQRGFFYLPKQITNRSDNDETILFNSVDFLDVSCLLRHCFGFRNF